MQLPGYSRVAVAANKSDSVDQAPGFTAKAIYFGGGAAADVKVTTVGGTTAIIPDVQPGTILPIQVRRIWSTGTGFADGDMILLGD